MRTTASRGLRIHHLTFRYRMTTAFVLFLFLSLAVVPAAALTPAGIAGIPEGAVYPSVNGNDATGSRTTLPPAVLTVQPTPVPARQNRSPIVQTVKNIVAERPKVTVPSGVFLLLVAIAAAGILAVLFLLIRRNIPSSGVPGTVKKPVPGNATVIEETAQPAPEPPGTGAGPAVPFPPSLGKRFLHPEYIGEGGLARVFRVQNTKTGMTVAVKVPIRFDEVTGTHFTRDIVFWQGLDHPNIIRILSTNILPVPYIEMEYAPSSLAATPLPLPEDKAVGLVLGIARGLAYAHAKGIVHRDIKPENILISENGIPRITDWGLGKAIGDTRQSSMIGFSPAYAAPEQIAPHRYGRPGPATDIYQLGMLLAELLTGSPVFGREGVHDLTMAILEEDPVIPSWDGRHVNELRAIIIRCLAKRPEDRFASAGDLIRNLESLQEHPE